MADFIPYVLKKRVKSSEDYPFEIESGKGPIPREPELIAILLEDLIPNCEKLKSAGRMGEIKKLGDRLINLGGEFSIPVLKSWGNCFLEYADGYDVNEIKKALNDFPIIAEKIIKHMEGEDGE